jgi:hypothetical protein
MKFLKGDLVVLSYDPKIMNSSMYSAHLNYYTQGKAYLVVEDQGTPYDSDPVKVTDNRGKALLASASCFTLAKVENPDLRKFL